MRVSPVEDWTILRPDAWPRGSGRVVLSFDDGPSPVTTGPVLDVLARHGVQAMFCHIGENMERWPELSRRVLDEGHELAVHTWTHGRFLPFERAKLLRETQRWIALAQEIAGDAEWQPRWFRPPGGITPPAVPHLLRETGLELATLTFFVNDALAGAEDGARVMYRNRHRLLANNGGAMVLHEMRYTGPETRFAIDKSWLAEALEALLIWGNAEGLRFENSNV